MNKAIFDAALVARGFGNPTKDLARPWHFRLTKI
jgi:hypothetical protein